MTTTSPPNWSRNRKLSASARRSNGFTTLGTPSLIIVFVSLLNLISATSGTCLMQTMILMLCRVSLLQAARAARFPLASRQQENYMLQACKHRHTIRPHSHLSSHTLRWLVDGAYQRYDMIFTQFLKRVIAHSPRGFTCKSLPPIRA